MKAETGNPDFEYLLFATRSAVVHYNMQMNIIVESEADFNAWLAGQKTIAEQNQPEPAALDSTQSVDTAILDSAIVSEPTRLRS
jgi:hypothetical protein